MSYSSDPDDASGLSNFFDFRFLVRHVRLVKGIALVLLLLAGAGLAACDVMPGLRDEAPKPPSDSLRFSYSPLNENAQSKSGDQPPSPYHCLTSVRTPDGPHRYRYQKVYLLYPEPLLEDTPNRVMHQTYRLHVQTNSRGNENDRQIQRLAHCRLPATPQAAGMLHEALRYHGEGTVIDLTEEAEQQTAAQRASTTDATTKLTDDELEDLWEWAEENGMKCTKMPDNGPGTGHVYCSDEEAVITGEGPGIPGGDPDLGGNPPAPWAGGGGGSGSSSGGNVPSPCIASNGGGYLCNPPNVLDYKLCPWDPLKDMNIRSTCAGVEGGRYGDTRGPNNNQFHGGLDLSAEVGTNLFAIGGGKVVQVDYLDAFGNYVVVHSNEDENRFALYAHLSHIDVEDQEIISEGDKIGNTGMSGNAQEADCNRAHLHLEVRIGKDTDYGWVKRNGGETRDPEKYIGTKFGVNGLPLSDTC